VPPDLFRVAAAVNAGEDEIGALPTGGVAIGTLVIFASKSLTRLTSVRNLYALLAHTLSGCAEMKATAAAHRAARQQNNEQEGV
jgi:hypothetical protein